MALPRRRKARPQPTGDTGMPDLDFPSLEEEKTPPKQQVEKSKPTRKKAVKKEPAVDPAKDFKPGKHNEYLTEFEAGYKVLRKKPDLDLGNGYAIDSVTGRKYRKLGQAVALDGDGETPSEEEMEKMRQSAFDIHNLNSEADQYLAHLRGSRD